jgi:hypothetical protein
VAWDVLELGCYGVGTFSGLGRFVAGTFWGWEVVQVGPYVVGPFVVGTFLGWDVLSWDVL